MIVFRYLVVYQAMLQEHLTSDSTCILKADPGKLDIKRREPGILFISLPIVSLLKLAIMTVFLCRFSVIDKKRNVITT